MGIDLLPTNPSGGRGFGLQCSWSIDLQAAVMESKKGGCRTKENEKGEREGVHGSLGKRMRERWGP